jgi:hypothetical protein
MIRSSPFFYWKVETNVEVIKRKKVKAHITFKLQHLAF